MKIDIDNEFISKLVSVAGNDLNLGFYSLPAQHFVLFYARLCA